MNTTTEQTGYVITDYYTCNGDQRGCERERFGGCRWCDETTADDRITSELAEKVLQGLSDACVEICNLDDPQNNTVRRLRSLQRRVAKALHETGAGLIAEQGDGR